MKVSIRMETVFHLVQSCLFKHKTFKTKFLPDEWESAKSATSLMELAIHWVCLIEPFSLLPCFILISLSFSSVICISVTMRKSFPEVEIWRQLKVITDKDVVTQKIHFYDILGKLHTKPGRHACVMLLANICHVDKHLLSHWASF